MLALALGVACGDNTPAGAGAGGPVVPQTADAASGPGDAAQPSQDAGAGAADAGGASADASRVLPLVNGLPALLSATGLYADITSQQLAPGVRVYAPQFELWSDGADKRRFLYLPEGTQIDTSNMDDWQFPLGTRVWKEFSRNGVRVETRLIEHTADGWKMLAYVWRDGELDADASELGELDARGTPHDVPDRLMCRDCHDGRPGRVLGVSALQLAHTATGLTLAGLAAEGLLSHPPATVPSVPGDATARAVLGGLHANCGHCHNPDSGEVADKAEGLHMWLTVDRLATVEGTPTYESTVGVTLSERLEGYEQRIVPGDAANSGLLHRIQLLPPDERAMPPVAVEEINAELLQALRIFVNGLP